MEAPPAQEPALMAAPAAGLRASVSRGRLVLIMVGVMLGMLLSALDQTIVGTAMPRVIADLQGLEHYAWVVTAYLLASTVMVPIYGKLSDIYGRRPFFLGGMAIFLLGSALSGTSRSMTQLIIFRAVQGLGAGAMMPIVQAIIGDIFPPAERGRWQGLLMSVFGLASIVGPVTGGWITDHWGWRWVFYVNMPVGVLALLTAGFALPAQSRRSRHQIDYFGAATLIAAAVPLLLAFSWAGSQYPWSSPQIIGLLVFAAVMAAVFLLIEQRAAEPIINPGLFANSIFAISVGATFLLSAGMFGTIIYLPLFIQAVVGQTATNSGAVLTPMMLGVIVSSAIGGQIMSRTGRYKALALFGFAVAAFGMFLLSRMSAATTSGLVIRNMVVTGIGLGVVMPLFTIVVQNAFPFRMLGQITASLQFFRSIGSTIGVAIFGTVMTNRLQAVFQESLPAAIRQAVPPERLAALQNPQALLSPQATAAIQQGFASLGPQGQQLSQLLLSTIRASLATAITDVFRAGTGLMLLALLIALWLKEIPLRRSHVRGEPAAPQAMLGELATDLAEVGEAAAGGLSREAVPAAVAEVGAGAVAKGRRA